MDVAENVPQRIVAGTTVKFTRLFDDYPTSEWDYTIYLAGKSLLNKAATVDGNKFSVTLTAEDTAVLKADVYKYVERVENEDGEVYEVGSGTVEVATNIATAAKGDFRSFARQMRDALRDRLVQLSDPSGTGGVFTIQSFTIAGRNVIYRNHEDMIKDLNFYEEAVRREEADERIARGIGSDPNKIRTRFARP